MSKHFKPFHDEDGVLFGDGRRGKGHGVRLLASGEARDHFSSQVGSLTVGKLVFGCCCCCVYLNSQTERTKHVQ